MSCNPMPPRFRLLDAYVGWDGAHTEGLEGLDNPDGLRLALVSNTGGDAPLAVIGTRILHPRLARKCEPCVWFMVTRAPPASRWLRLDACNDAWHALPDRACVSSDLQDAAAIASSADMLAIADRALGWVILLNDRGERILGEAHIAAPRALAFSPYGELLVAAEGRERLIRLDRSGIVRGEYGPPLPPGKINRFAFDRQGRLWVVIARDGDRGELWRAERGAPEYLRATLAELLESFLPSGVTFESEQGFCLQRADSNGLPAEACYSWYGRPLSRDCLRPPAAASRVTMGQLLTTAIDSGIPRCQWHRLRVDADVPDGARLEIAVATSEAPNPPAQGSNGPPWDTFPAGVPHPEDWQTIPTTAQDALILLPAGRYLFVRLRLTGDGTATPIVRRVHLDFPRTTSASLLPAVYREEEAGDFTERFVSLFDATLGEIDRGVEQFAAMLDPQGVPDETLEWIASLLGIVFDPSWEPERRRQLLAAAPSLFRQRGTPRGLAEAIRLVFNVEPVIVETGSTRAWGALPRNGQSASAAFELRHSRLFSRGSARLTLGQSQLGRARINSFGDPANDPHSAGAFRFSVAVPPGAGVRLDRLRRLVERQKPAHTLADVRVGGAAGFVLTPSVQLGVDTVFRAPPRIVLGDGRTRLNRQAVLGSRREPGAVLHGRTAC
jgi:phage tail-like protein